MLGFRRLPHAEECHRTSDVRGHLLASSRSFCGRPCHQVGPGQKRLVLTFDRVDGGRASPSLRIVENVVVNQRADLNQLDSYSRRDNAGIERLSNVGHRQCESRTEALSTPSDHSEARGRQVWCTDRAGGNQPVAYRLEVLPES